MSQLSAVRTDTLKSKLSLVCFYSLFFFLPFAGVRASMWVTILFILSVAVSEPLSLSRLLTFRKYPIQTGLMACFVVYVVWLIGTDDFKTGFRELEKHITWILFPMIFSLSKFVRDSKSVANAFKCFCLGCLFTALVCFADAIWRNYQTNGLSQLLPELYTNFALVSIFDLHPTYLSLHIAFAYFIFLDNILYRKLTVKNLIIILLISVSVLFILFLLRARIVLLVFGALAVLYFLNYMRDHFSKKGTFMIAATIFLAACIGIGSLFFLDQTFKSRLSQMIKFDTGNLVGSNAENGVTQRVFLWGRSISAIKKAPLLGYGTGDGDAALQNEIITFANDPTLNHSAQQIEAMVTIKELFNSHNQYMTDLLKFGVVGTIPFLLLIVLCAKKAYKQNDKLFAIFLILTVLTATTESILIRQKGIVFFAVFLILFSIRDQYSSSCEKDEIA
jgi:O-antigen ligase